MKKTNAKQHAKVFYGLHMTEGVAEYDEDTGPTRIFIGNDVINKMNPTFAGKPIFVDHQETDLDNLHEQADGYVVESFFNKSDGKFWSKFVITSDEGHQAISKGWTLSNCYEIKSSAGGGKWHNVDFDQEVMAGEFDHLAIVQNPRYEESIILTPEEFRAYNVKKESELAVLCNSKGDSKVAFKLFKKQKLENSSELENAVVEMEDGTEISIKDMIETVRNANDAAKVLAKKKAKNEIDKEEKIAVGDVSMTVAELISKYQDLLKKHESVEETDSKENSEDDEKKKDKEKENSEDDEKKKDKEAKEKTEKENSEDDEDEKKKKKENALKLAEKKAIAEKLKNATSDPESFESGFVDTSIDQIQRGRDRYGS